MNKTQNQMGDDQNVKTDFEIDEIGYAISEAYRAKFQQNWTGVIQLITDTKKIFLVQYASSNSYARGYKTIFTIEEYTSISDLVEGLEYDDDGKIKKDDYNTFSPSLSKGEYFMKFLHDSDIFESAIERAEEIISEMQEDDE